MDATCWLKQFNLMLADRGEIEDIPLLEPKSAVEGMRKEISQDRNRRRRDVAFRRSRTDISILETSEGAISDHSPQREGRYTPDDYIRSRAVLIDLRTYQSDSTVIVPGDIVIIKIPGHVYHNREALILGLSKGRYDVEITLKSSKGLIKLDRKDFVTRGTDGN